jgi:signal transduction histidine kinase
MAGLALLLHRYARRMDARISREQAEKESRMRRELTQNIAHELKTPVASILGYTDTIIDHPDMSEQMRQQFIERTNAQARRLTALLQDISTLNRMDYAPDMLSIERVDVAQIVTEIASETALAVDRKHMTLKNCLPQSIIVHGNASLIYSIFRNLMDNAICHAGEGTVIEISADDGDDYWHFTFADTGRGIDESVLRRPGGGDAAGPGAGQYQGVLQGCVHGQLHHADFLPGTAGDGDAGAVPGDVRLHEAQLYGEI